MRISTRQLLIGLILFCSPRLADAAEKRSLQGVVITPHGNMMPRFFVAAKRIDHGPELGIRHRFKDGVFKLENLPGTKYEIVVHAPEHVSLRFQIDLKNNPQAERIIVLYPFRNEVRYLSDSHYSVSLPRLKQKIPEKAVREYLDAVEFHREGQVQKALISYGRAISAFPQYARALADVGALYILIDEPETGLRYLQRAFAADRSDPFAQINMAVAQTALGNCRQAVKLLEGVIRAESHKSLPRFYLAKVLFSQQDYVAARETLKQVLAEDSQFFDAWLLLLNISLEQNDIAEARNALFHLQAMNDSPAFARVIEAQLTALEARVGAVQEVQAGDLP